MARQRDGYKEVCVYITEDEYADLEHYWRYHTKKRYISHVVADLINNGVRRVLKKGRE